jgi:hypothetical protein
MIAAVLGDVKMPPPRPSGKARNSKTQLSNVERHLLDGFTPEAAAGSTRRRWDPNAG